MLNISSRCKGAFIGHAIGSNCDSSICMAIEISESLLEHKQFDGRDILSRYLLSYHIKHPEIGETTKQLYNIVMDKIQATGNKSSISRQDFLLDQSIIDEYVKIIDTKLNGLTAGCGPAQRSFPLVFCPWIDDSELFRITKIEAALTHFSPLAGQVAGVVNLICRLLLRNRPWVDAVRYAFSSPGLSRDVISVYERYTRSPDPFTKTHEAHAPTVLNAALYYVHQSKNASEAIEKAHGAKSYYSAPIVGLLAGMRWGIPDNMYTGKVNDPQFVTIRDTVNKLSCLWPMENQNVTN